MAELDRIVVCRHCQRPEYWGEMRWLSGFCACRNCYKSMWERENHKMYTWDDLDGPRPSQEDLEAQMRAEKFDAQSLKLQLATDVPKSIVDCYLVNSGRDDYICKQYNGGCAHIKECQKLIAYENPITKEDN